MNEELEKELTKLLKMTQGSSIKSSIYTALLVSADWYGNGFKMFEDTDKNLKICQTANTDIRTLRNTNLNTISSVKSKLSSIKSIYSSIEDKVQSYTDLTSGKRYIYVITNRKVV